MDEKLPQPRRRLVAPQPHLRLSKDAPEGLAGEHATLKKEAAVIGALTAQDQKLVCCPVGDQSLDLGHKEKISDERGVIPCSRPEQRP